MVCVKKKVRKREILEKVGLLVNSVTPGHRSCGRRSQLNFLKDKGAPLTLTETEPG